jgi:hypothetical protein
VRSVQNAVSFTNQPCGFDSSPSHPRNLDSFLTTHAQRDLHRGAVPSIDFVTNVRSCHCTYSYSLPASEQLFLGYLHKPRTSDPSSPRQQPHRSIICGITCFFSDGRSGGSYRDFVSQRWFPAIEKPNIKLRLTVRGQTIFELNTTDALPGAVHSDLNSIRSGQ